MNAKRILTVSLLLFVVASLAWLGVKEVRHFRAVKAAQEVPSPPPTAAIQPVLPVPAAIASPAPREVKTPPRPARAVAPTAPTAKNPPPAKGGALSTSPAGVAPPLPTPAKSKVIVYYLHTTVRCANCLRIESYAASAVTGGFAGPLSEGRLEWKVLNVDDPPNAHFVKDYQLFTKSVVISEVKDGKEVRWKRLDKVWDLLGDQQAFERYVKDEVKAYLGDA